MAIVKSLRPELLDEVALRRRCMAAGKTCLTAAGCTCHHMTSAPTAAPPDCPPLLTQPGDLGEHHTKPSGYGWVAGALCWIVGVPACLAAALFVANLLIDLARRLTP